MKICPRNTGMNLKDLPIDRIPLHEEGLSFSFPPEPGSLKDSIEEVGLLHPPHLVEEKKGSFFVASGFRRIRALSELGWEKIPAFLHPAEVLSPRQAFVMNLSENLASRTLNAVEKAFALKRLAFRLGVKRREILCDFMPRLGLPSRSKLLESYLSLTGLDEDILRDIASGKFHVRSAMDLLLFPPSQCSRIYRFFNFLKLSTNAWCEILTNLHEIGRRDKVEAYSILERKELGSIQGNLRLTSSVKREEVRSFLRRLRNPGFAKLERKYRHALRRLGLPPGVHLENPTRFERSTIRLSCEFQSPQDAAALVRGLSAALDKGTMDVLFDTLRGEEKE